MKVIYYMFSIGFTFLDISLYDNEFEFKIISAFQEIYFYDSIFSEALPLFPLIFIRKRSYMAKEQKIKVSNNIPD